MPVVPSKIILLSANIHCFLQQPVDSSINSNRHHSNSDELFKSPTLICIMDITRSVHILQELLSMGSHKQYSYQLKLWDEMMNAILLSKRLSDSYFHPRSIHDDDDQSNLNNFLKAFKMSKEKAHVILDRLVSSFVEKEYDDDHNTSSNIEILDQTQVSQENIVHYERHSRTFDGKFMTESKKCVTGKPRYRSRSRSQEHMASSEINLRSDTKIEYLSETEYQSQAINSIRYPSYSDIPTESRNVNESSSNYHYPIEREKRNRSRSKSRDSLIDRHEFDARNTYSSVTRHRSRSRNLNRSSPNNRIQTQHGRRNRSRSRSHNEQQLDYVRKRKRLPRIRRKTLENRRPVSKYKPSSTSKNSPSPRSSEKLQSESRQKHNEHSSQNQRPYKNNKKSASSQRTEELPMPVINSSETMIQPPQNVCQDPRQFYQNPINATAMYYPPPTHMPQLMAPPYYMPPRPRLLYPPTYPRIYYRPPWQPQI